MMINPPSNIKIITSLLLSIILLIGSIFAYKRLSNFNGLLSGTFTALEVQEAKRVASSLTKEANQAVLTSQKRHQKSIDQVIQISSVVTPEIMYEIKDRERVDMEAISALQLALSASEKVVSLRDYQVTQVGGRIIFWQIISGILVVIAIILAL